MIKSDYYEAPFTGKVGLQVKELIDCSMFEVLGPTPTGHFYYVGSCPKFKSKETGRTWWGIYENKDGVIWCKDQYNSKHSIHFELLELVK